MREKRKSNRKDWRWHDSANVLGCPGVDDDLDEEKRCYEGLGDFLEVCSVTRST